MVAEHERKPWDKLVKLALINTKINLFVQENLLVLMSVGLDCGYALRKQTNHKIDFGMKQASNFNITSIKHVRIWNSVHCTSTPRSYCTYISSCFIWALHFFPLWASWEMPLHSRYLCVFWKFCLPSEKYPLPSIEQVFTACELEQQSNRTQSHKSHRNSVPFLYINRKSHKWHRISMSMKYPWP